VSEEDIMIGYIQNLDVQIPNDLIQYWGWFLAFGIALVVLGVFAIGRAVTATIVSMLFFGWLLLIACGIEVAQAIIVGHWAGFFHHLVAAILFGVIGFFFVTRPLLSAEVATMLMAVFFLIGGLFQIVTSAWVALPGWGWQLADGIITFILGVLIVAQWPVSGLWVIGLFIGIDLIFYGGAWIALALGLRGSS
jgi:uncharacterized membrane protein HdeD (DUF308 family)